MRATARIAVALAALALLAAGGASGSASTLPRSSSGTAAAAKFSACLVTNTAGIHRGLNKVSWHGMKAAAAAEPHKIRVRYLASQTDADYAANISTFIAEKCGLIVTVGSTMAPETKAAAKANRKFRFAIVDCSYKSHCLTGRKLKNIASVKGTAKAVKKVVLATARRRS
jgi:basic membrane protein A and related proteins